MLGWNHDEGSCIVTRYEIVEHFKGGKDYKGGIKVKLASDKHAYIFNLHLPSHPYQPYQLLGIRPKWHKHTNNITFIKTEAETIEWAKKARGAEIRKLLRQIKFIPDKEAPGQDGSCCKSRSAPHQSGVPHFQRNGQGWL